MHGGRNTAVRTHLLTEGQHPPGGLEGFICHLVGLELQLLQVRPGLTRPVTHVLLQSVGRVRFCAQARRVTRKTPRRMILHKKTGNTFGVIRVGKKMRKTQRSTLGIFPLHSEMANLSVVGNGCHYDVVKSSSTCSSFHCNPAVNDDGEDFCVAPKCW